MVGVGSGAVGAAAELAVLSITSPLHSEHPLGLEVGFCKKTMTAVLNLMELEMLNEDIVGSQEYLK